MLTDEQVNHVLFKYEWDQNYLVADVTWDLNALFEEEYDVDRMVERNAAFDAAVSNRAREIVATQRLMQAAYEDTRRQE